MKSATITPERAGTLGELLRVAVPLILSSGVNALMYVIDRVFLSHDSLDSMAASLPAAVLHWNLMSLGMGTVMYANAFIGQYEGAGEHRRVGPVLWQGIYLSLIMAGLILLIVPLSPWIFAWFNHESAVQALELRFFKILCYGSGPLLIATTLSCFYSGRGQTKVILLVDATAMLVNVGLDYLLIFGNFGFPRMGIDGAALATITAFTSMAVMYIGIILFSRRTIDYRLWAGRAFDRELFGRLLKFGLPSGGQQFLDIACWTMFVQLVGRLGKDQLTATSLIFNLNSLAFVPLIGLGTAVTSLVGHRIGEGRPKLAVRTVWLAIGVAELYTALFAMVYLFAPGLILMPYDLADHESVRELVTVLLRFVAVYSLFDALAVVFNSAIRGAGDTRFALKFSFSCGILLLVTPTYLATWLGYDDFTLVWYFVTTFIAVLGIGFMLRFRGGRWMTMRVIEHTATELDPDTDAEKSGATLDAASSAEQGQARKQAASSAAR